MGDRRRIWLIGFIGFLAFFMAFAGVFIGRKMSEPSAPAPQFEVHAQLHQKLNLRPEQRARLAAVEEKFNERRKLLVVQMKSANEKLAYAIETEHRYGPDVTAAYDEMHHILGELQKETLQYLFATRAVLDEQQAEEFDEILVHALTAEMQ